MTEVRSRLKYAKQEVVKYPDLEQARKADQKAIRDEIKAQTPKLQRERRVTSVSSRYVRTATTVGLPLAVLVNGQKLMDCEPTPETVATCYTEIKDALNQFIEDNPEVNVKIEGVLG